MKGWETVWPRLRALRCALPATRNQNMMKTTTSARRPTAKFFEGDTHISMDVVPVLGVRVPSGHISQTELLECALNVLSGQGRQELLAGPEYSPGLQKSRCDIPPGL